MGHGKYHVTNEETLYMFLFMKLENFSTKADLLP